MERWLQKFIGEVIYTKVFDRMTGDRVTLPTKIDWSSLQMCLSYVAMILFLISLVLPALYSGPILNADATRYQGFVVWILSFLGIIMAPVDLVRAVLSAVLPSEYSDYGYLTLALWDVQLALHAFGNFLVLFAPWLRITSRFQRWYLYGCTVLALIWYINPETRRDLLIGYYFWLAAHVLLSGLILWTRRKSILPQ